MLFYFSLFITIIYFFRTLIKSLRLGYPLTIHYILPLCYIIFIFLNPLILDSDLINDENFNLLVLVGTIGMVVTVTIVPYDFIDSARNWNKSYRPKYEIKCRLLNFGALIYLCYLFYEMISKVITVGSFTAVFTINRLEKGLGDDYFGGNALLIFMLFFRIFYYIKTYYFFVEKKYLKFTFFYLIPMFHHLMTAITRFDFVIMFIALIFLIIDEKISLKSVKSKFGEDIKKRTKISLIKLLVYIVPFIFFLFSYMQIANNIRSGFSGGESSSNSVSWTDKAKVSVAIDLNYYNFLYDLYKEVNNNNEYDYGKSWFFYPIMNFIPRNIWNDKPLTAFSPRYTEKIYYKLGTGRPVFTFTILGEGYAQFGLLGVFLAPILFVYSRYFGISILKKIKGVKILILITLLSLITYFRGEQPIFYVFLELIYTFIIISFFCKKIIRN